MSMASDGHEPAAADQGMRRCAFCQRVAALRDELARSVGAHFDSIYPYICDQLAQLKLSDRALAQMWESLDASVTNEAKAALFAQRLRDKSYWGGYLAIWLFDRVHGPFRLR